MEVAGQWRREWAGSAEYGKVTEGGVTRRVARAMEVLHASTQGARVRVMRAAYHSSAGPGAPASSFLMHSSRRVISSGFNLLEPPSFPTKPLEISSTPLESSPESNTDGENYKVTEPDDFEISEPSKWRSSTAENSIRMPSEESSSTDNASIIDLDSRNHKNVFRKYSYDSESSEIPSRRNSARASPLLDAPVALSTLKYKSLLNGSNDWNNRRKSYSFEDTSPLNETIIHNNDTLAMESSTDSGICKSTEIVNDADEKYLDRAERRYDKHEETFKDWLSKNRLTTPFYKGNQVKTYRDHDVVFEDPRESNITLQSKGKVSITVPITLEADDHYQNKKNHGSDDGDRKIKRVEFCKTELHFAADSGKVNIIATDEKPPPTNDFRKRRSAFVPINGNFEKPITLFGENKEFSEGGSSEISPCSEICEFEENTAATKSILKNKIPKPKPYLLGENMVFGQPEDRKEKKEENFDSAVPTAVTLINKQLQSERRYSNEHTSSLSSEIDASVIKQHDFRTSKAGPFLDNSLKIRKRTSEIEERSVTTNSKDIATDIPLKNKLKIPQLSPIEGRAKTRQLRESDLTFFGLKQSQRMSNNEQFKYDIRRKSLDNNGIGTMFNSVKLIQQVSNSGCNSETESDDAPEYQNLPLKTNFAPVPTPRARSKYIGDTKDKEVKILKPVIEQDNEDNTDVYTSRRSRLRRQEDSMIHTNRSISAPPKTSIRYHLIENTPRLQQDTQTYLNEKVSSLRSNKNNNIKNSENEGRKNNRAEKFVNNKNTPEEEPLYVNFNVNRVKRDSPKTGQRSSSSRRSSEQQPSTHNYNIVTTNKSDHFKINIKSTHDRSHKRQDKDKNKTDYLKPIERTNCESDSLPKKLQSLNKNRVKRTEKLATPEYSRDPQNNISSIKNKLSNKKDEQGTNHKLKTEHPGIPGSSRGYPAIKQIKHDRNEDSVTKDSNKAEKRDLKDVTELEDNGIVKYRARPSSNDKMNERKSSKSHQKLDTNSSDSFRNSTLTSRAKEKDINTKERIANPRSDTHKTSKRSEYVINYDDKNGTVSSICKVKPGSGTPRKQNILKDIVSDIPKEKTKKSEKKTLLQFPDRQWNPIETRYTYADKKWRKKMHVQRSCQLL